MIRIFCRTKHTSITSLTPLTSLTSHKWSPRNLSYLLSHRLHRLHRFFQPRIERMTRIISDGKLFDLADELWKRVFEVLPTNGKDFIHSARWIKYWWCLKYYESSFSIILNDNINNPSDGNYWIIFGDYCLNHKQPVWYICEYLWYLWTLWRRNLGIGGAY
jgi:hypothetical protein